jgi:hypothetical protein
MLIAMTRKYMVDVPGLLEGLGALVAFVVVVWGLQTWDRKVVLVAVAASVAILFVSTLRLWRRAGRLRDDIRSQLDRLEERLARLEDFTTNHGDIRSQLDRLGERLGGLEHRLEERLGRLEDFTANHGDIRSQLDRVGERLGGLEHRLDERLGRLEAWLDERLGRLEGVVELLEPRTTSVDAKLQFLVRDADVVRNSIIRLTASGSLPFEFYTAGSFDPELSMLPILARQLSSLIVSFLGSKPSSSDEERLEPFFGHRLTP